MKRSEIVNLIAEFLWKSNDEYGLKSIAKEDAQELLKKLEQAGMKPKGYYGLLSGVKYDPNNLEHQGRDVEYFHNWELENE